MYILTRIPALCHSSANYMFLSKSLASVCLSFICEMGCRRPQRYTHAPLGEGAGVGSPTPAPQSRMSTEFVSVPEEARGVQEILGTVVSSGCELPGVTADN